MTATTAKPMIIEQCTPPGPWKPIGVAIPLELLPLPPDGKLPAFIMHKDILPVEPFQNPKYATWRQWIAEEVLADFDEPKQLHIPESWICAALDWDDEPTYLEIYWAEELDNLHPDVPHTITRLEEIDETR